jgi:iron(III) transport system permease protein
LGLGISLLDARHGERKVVRGLQYLAMLPFGLPSIVLGAGLILAFTRQPFVLYGTLWILLVAYVIKFVPLAVRTCSVGLRQIDPALDEAARISGASGSVRLFKITLPLMRGSLLASGFLVFVPSFRELGASILLSGPGTETVAVAMMQSWGSVAFETVCAMGVLALFISLLASRLVSGVQSSPTAPSA